MILVLTPFLIKAQFIELGIKEIIDKEVGPLFYNKSISNNPFLVSFEIFNSGSVGYRARVRMDIYKDKNFLFSGWSKEHSLNPGIRSKFDIYWFPVNLTGNFIAKIRVYYGNEMDDLKPINFKVKNTLTPKDVVEITNFKTYNDEIIFNIKSDQTLNNVLFIPSDYPLGWVFEQKKIENLEKNEKKQIVIPYEPTLWRETELTINVITEDGEYYTKKQFSLEREGRLSQLLHYLLKIFKESIKI